MCRNSTHVFVSGWMLGNIFRVVMQWHSCPGSGGVTIPGGVQSHGDVALRDVVSGHGGGGLGLDLGTLVVFSNLNNSMIP